MNASRALWFGALISALLTVAACAGSSSDDGSGPPPPAQNQSAPGPPNEPLNAVAEAAAVDSLKFIVTTALGLTVEDIGASYGEIVRIARSAGGYVSSSNVSTGQEGRASIEVRVSAGQLDSVLADLRALPGSKVESESVTAREVTTEYIDLQSRLRNLERTEAQYQQFLNQAKTIDEVLDVDARMQSTRDEIEKTKGRIALFDNQVEYATVKLQLSVAVPAKVEAKDTRPAPIRALHGAWDVSVDVFWLLLSLGAILAVGLAWVIPLAFASIVVMRLYRRYGGPLERLKL